MVWGGSGVDDGVFDLGGGEAESAPAACVFDADAALGCSAWTLGELSELAMTAVSATTATAAAAATIPAWLPELVAFPADFPAPPPAAISTGAAPAADPPAASGSTP